MKLVFTFFLLIGLSSFTYAQNDGYQTIKDIPYYDHKISAQNISIAERCLLDIYYPNQAEGYSTIVWFHGGGLTGGEKELPHELMNKGMAVVGVNYRLAPSAQAPDYIHDAAAAVAWVFNNIAQYGGDPDKIFISGHSAGGYLAMMIGLDKTYLAHHEIDANRIAGLIPLSGQTITHFTIRAENQIDEKQPTVDKYAPLYHVRPDAPPLLLITGDRELEMLGRYEENAYLARMMKVAGHNQTRLLELQGYGHGMTYPAYPLLLEEVERLSR